MSDTDFDQKIDSLTQDLNLPEKVNEKSKEISEQIRNIENYKYSFVSFGGFDAMVATSIYIAAKQEQTPLPPQKMVEAITNSPDINVSQNFSSKKLKQTSRKFRRKLDIEPVFLTPEHYIDYYLPQLEIKESGVKQETLRDLMYLSEVAVRYTYKEITENLTGVDTTNKNLSDVEVTKESFGYHGNNHSEFAKHILEKVREENLDAAGKSPQALAAASIYIAAKLI